MAANRKPGSRPGLIHCEYCGEDYSSTYRRCPFCDEYDEYEAVENTAGEHRTSPRGGKRVAQSRRRGGGYTRVSPVHIIAALLSLAVILAAVWIVVTQLGPLINRGNVDTIDPDAPGTNQTSPPPETTPPVEEPEVTEPGTEIDPPEESDEPEQPNSDTAVGFTLNKTEFSFSDVYPDPITLTVTFSPAGTTATITWSSSNPEIASVDENGKISHGAKKGNATITAEMANGVKQTCLVHNDVNASATTTTTPQPSPSQNVSSTYEISKADFTFFRVGETYRVTVKNYSGGVTWSSSNTGVATVAADGTCKAVSNGKCTVTGKLDDGSTVEAIVRVDIR